MCQNRRCAAVPSTEWVELVFQYRDGYTKRVMHAEAAGVALVNVYGTDSAWDQDAARVWWADEYDAAHPTSAPVPAVGPRGGTVVI